MTTPGSYFRSILIFSLAIIYLGNLVIKSNLLSGLITILLVIIICLNFPKAIGSSRVIGYFSFSISILLLLAYHAPLAVWVDAMKKNLNLIVMFTLVRLLTVPIKKGGYSAALKGFFPTTLIPPIVFMLW